MAHPIGFREANQILSRPPGMTAEQCVSLEVFQDGEFCVSRWQLTDDDLAELKRNGGKVYLIVWGATQPPVCVVAPTPFCEQPAK